MSLQSVTFNNKWNSIKARDWLRKHKIKPIKKVHKVGKLLRYRIREPRFRRYITKKSSKGINLVLGY